MNKYLLGSFLAALALFFWGFLFWVVSPLPKSAFEVTADDAAAGAMLKQMFPKDGAYYIPGHGNDEATKVRLHEAGPIATVHIRHAGGPVMPPKALLMGFVHNWLTTLLLTFLLVKTSAAVLSSYGSRVWFVTLVGVAIAVISDFSFPVWWGHPWPAYVLNAVFSVTGMLVAGLVLAKFVKPAE